MATRIGTISWLGMGLMALFAGALFLGGLQSLWFAWHHEQAIATVLRYEASQRTVTERKLVPASSGGTTEVLDSKHVPVRNPVLRFTLDGRIIDVMGYGTSMHEPYPIGSEVRVLFLRGNPEAAVLADTDWGAAGAIIQLLTGAIVALMLYWVYRLLRGQPPAFLRSWRMLPNTALTDFW